MKHVAKALRLAASELDGPTSIKEALDELLTRTGRAEDLLATMADIYAEKAMTEEYADSVAEMKKTEELLRQASQSVADVWD